MSEGMIEVKRFTIGKRSGSWAPLMPTGTGGECLCKLLFDDGECVIARMVPDKAKETK
jgi:hypothetical protein